MTKAEIVQALYARVGGFSKKESADIVDMVFEMMKETLGRGEKIKISGFGNFVLRDKRQRPGRNPQTGDPIKISERRVLTFKASQILKQALNPRDGNGALDPVEEEEEDDDTEHGDSDAPAPVAPSAAPETASTATSHIAAPPAAVAAPVSNEAPKE
ncbi:MAG TPA: integration host factor subunit alpha [Labilithrix sp.]|jgi:integration host factor subunit alpha|nr:integration host factor subunit alpha [Labilithrix sp.]